MADSRERILERLRQAVAGKAAPAEASAPAHRDESERPLDLSLFVERFRNHLIVGGETYGSAAVVTSLDELRERCAAIAGEHGVRSWVAWPTALCEEASRALGECPEPARPAVHADAAIVEAEMLCLETGVFALRSGPGRARSDALLPEVQIVLARASTLVDRLDEALARTAEISAGQVVWIAGPSRTADIEKTLVVPAHGAREVHLIVLEDR